MPQLQQHPQEDGAHLPNPNGTNSFKLPPNSGSTSTTAPANTQIQHACHRKYEGVMGGGFCCGWGAIETAAAGPATSHIPAGTAQPSTVTVTLTGRPYWQGSCVRQLFGRESGRCLSKTVHARLGADVGLTGCTFFAGGSSRRPWSVRGPAAGVDHTFPVPLLGSLLANSRRGREVLGGTGTKSPDP